ncbi:MAG TPA: cyanophycin synthetase, partial [Clostridia bacterium]|nr:cyanophycin synthetase [Clostridia bacterium]
FSIVIDYAHTPDGLENILNAVKPQAGRVIPVFGCGGNRDRTKRPIMGEIAGRYGDMCIITSDNPRFEEPLDIISEIETGMKKTGCPYIVIENREKAIKYAILNAKKGDIIVIAGKGAEDYQEIKGVKYPFSDSDKVREILAASF